jgi:signal transduction histidine kinase
MTIGKSSRLLILFLLAAFSGHAQPLNFEQRLVDSLERVLPKAANDTNKVNNLVSLSRIYQAKIDHDRSLSYARMADTLSLQLNYDRGRVLSLAQIAFVYASTGNWPRSFVAFDEVWPIAQKAYPEQLPFLCNIMYMNYSFRFEWNTAKSWGLKSLNEPVFQKLPDQGKWPTYMQLALAYASLDKLDSAEYYAGFLKPYIDPLNLGDIAYRPLGLIARKKKNYKQAIDYYGRHPANATGLAKVYDELGQTDSAIYYAKIGLEHATRGKTSPDVIESSFILARLYESIDTSLAYKYLQIHLNAKDSLYGSNRREEEEQRILAKQKEEFQKESQAANFRNRIIQIALFALAAVFLVSTLLFLRSNRIKQNANRKLEKAYGDLKATQAQLIQSEKMASLGELTAGIAHEIQNPLNFVNNFSEVNKELLSELKDEAEKGNTAQVKVIADDIIQNQDKINHHGKRADAIVKGMLQHSRTSSGKIEPTDINAIADEYFRLAFHGMCAKDKSFNATIKTEFDNNIGKINVNPQEIGRVILNLINNAFYAVNEKAKLRSAAGGYEPRVVVSTKKNGDKVEIAVEDNGDGIPQKLLDKIFQPFFTTKPTGQGTGLGLSLAYDIVKAHGGVIKVETKEARPPAEADAEAGTEFIIQLPGTSNIP